MRYSSILIVVIGLFLIGCFEAPNVTENGGNIQKELNNRKPRKINPEDEELFGLVWTEDILNTFSSVQLDSISEHKYISVSRELIRDTAVAEEVKMMFEAYSYELERGQELSVQSFHNKRAERAYYYASKPLFLDSSFVGITYLKIDAAEVRRNMPE